MSLETASVEHPWWCSPAECLGTAPADRIHLSTPALARSRCGDLTISVQLAQLGHDAPAITMVATYADYGPDHPAEEYPIRLDADLARAVGWLLLTTGRQAARGQDRNPRP
jgi:hypothetical protein